MTCRVERVSLAIKRKISCCRICDEERSRVDPARLASVIRSGACGKAGARIPETLALFNTNRATCKEKNHNSLGIFSHRPPNLGGNYFGDTGRRGQGNRNTWVSCRFGNHQYERLRHIRICMKWVCRNYEKAFTASSATRACAQRRLRRGERRGSNKER